MNLLVNTLTVVKPWGAYVSGDRWPRNCLATRQVFLGIAWDLNGSYNTGICGPMLEVCVRICYHTMKFSLLVEDAYRFPTSKPHWGIHSPWQKIRKPKLPKDLCFARVKCFKIDLNRPFDRNEMQMMIVSSGQSFLCMDSWMMCFCICWGCSYIVKFQCPKPNMDTLLGWCNMLPGYTVVVQTSTKQGSCSHPKPLSSLWWVGIRPFCIILCGLWVCQVTLLRFPIPYICKHMQTLNMKQQEVDEMLIIPATS